MMMMRMMMVMMMRREVMDNNCPLDMLPTIRRSLDVGNIDDQCRGPNIKEKDHQAG